MSAEHPVEFKCKVIQRYKKGESIKDLSQVSIPREIAHLNRSN